MRPLFPLSAQTMDATVTLLIHRDLLPLAEARRFEKLRSASWFVMAADLSTMRIRREDVLTFFIDDEFTGPGNYVMLYSFGSTIRASLEVRWFLWRHGAR